MGIGTCGNQRVTEMKGVHLPALASCGQAELELKAGMGQGTTVVLVGDFSGSRKTGGGRDIVKKTLSLFLFGI